MMLRAIRACDTLKRAMITAPCRSMVTYRSLRLTTVLRSVASHRIHTNSVLRDQSLPDVDLSHFWDPKQDANTMRAVAMRIVAIETSVKTRASESREHGNLDTALETYLIARKTFSSKSLISTQQYLYEQLTTPKPRVRDKDGQAHETYEEFRKRLPWPNTSPELREAFCNDIGSKNVPAQKQQAYLKLYNPTDQDPEPFLCYCDRIAARSERAKGSRHHKSILVWAMSKECKDALVILRHKGLREDAAWLAAFSSYSFYKNSPRWIVKSIAPRFESREHLAKLYERMKISNHWN